MAESNADELGEWFGNLISQANDRSEALQDAHRHLVEGGYLHNVVLHQYQCRRGCQIATVFKVGGTVLCAVRDYKFSRGLNAERSVAAAREKNTLDGDRWWPAHVYDVEELDRFSAGDNLAGMSMNCRHYTGTVLASDVLKTVEGVVPGKKSAPTRLS